MTEIDLKRVQHLDRWTRVRFAAFCADTVKTRIQGSGASSHTLALAEQAIAAANQAAAANTPHNGSILMLSIDELFNEKDLAEAARAALKSAKHALAAASDPDTPSHTVRAYDEALNSAATYKRAQLRQDAKRVITEFLSSCDNVKKNTAAESTAAPDPTLSSQKRGFLDVAKTLIRPTRNQELKVREVVLLCVGTSVCILAASIAAANLDKSKLALLLGVPALLVFALAVVRLLTTLLTAKWRARAQVRALAAGGAIASSIVAAGLGGGWRSLQLQSEFPWLNIAQPDTALIAIGIAVFLASAAASLFFGLASDALKFSGSILLLGSAGGLLFWAFGTAAEDTKQSQAEAEFVRRIDLEIAHRFRTVRSRIADSRKTDHRVAKGNILSGVFSIAGGEWITPLFPEFERRSAISLCDDLLQKSPAEQRGSLEAAHKVLKELERADRDDYYVHDMYEMTLEQLKKAEDRAEELIDALFVHRPKWRYE